MFSLPFTYSLLSPLTAILLDSQIDAFCEQNMYLKTTHPHAKSHAVKIDVIWQGSLRPFTFDIGKLFNERRWSVHILEDW